MAFTTLEADDDDDATSSVPLFFFFQTCKSSTTSFFEKLLPIKLSRYRVSRQKEYTFDDL